MNIEEQIKSQILSKKSDLRLDRFLNKALYDNNGYYYKKNQLGQKDFVTSPEICQIFGEIIGLYLYFFGKIKLILNLIL